MPWFAGVARSRIDWGPTIDPEMCAITFPPVDELRRTYNDNHIWKHVKQAMIEVGKISEGS